MADNFYSSYPVEGGGSGGVTTLNSLSGALTLVAGSGITVTPSGSNITIAATGGGGGANTALSNLTSPTAINQTLIAGGGGGILSDTAPQTSIDWENRLLVDSVGVNSIQWDSGNRYLIDSSAIAVLQWDASLHSGSIIINANLVPTADTSFNLGNVGFAFNNVYVGKLKDDSGVNTIQNFDRNLMDSSGILSIDWTGRTLQNPSGVTTVDYGAGVLADLAGSISIDFNTRQLSDSLGTLLVDYSNGGTVFGGNFLRLPNFAADPGSGNPGDCYYNTTVNKIKVFTGATWETVTSA